MKVAPATRGGDFRISSGLVARPVQRAGPSPQPMGAPAKPRE